MKTIKQIKQLVEIFSTNSDSTSNNSLLTSVRDNYIPLFQFNIEAFSSEKAQLVFEKIGENVSRRTSVPYLPDGLHTKDQIGIQTFETPTIMEWMGGQSGQNFVINYSNKSANKAEARLNQLVVDMLLSLPSRSINIHFVDLAFSAQASFLTRNLDEKIYGKLISSSNDWNHLKDSLREKMAKALEEYGDVAKYNDSKNRVVVPYDVVVINDYQKCVNEMSDLDALFENGHKGGIYFILMNNLDFKSDRDIDSLMALKDFYQVLEAENFGNYSKDAFRPITTPEEGEEYMLKPMNCPHHCEVFAWKPRSYKDLPLRIAEFGTVYRYEKSGELHGLTRVRSFTQDDAHIFCRPDQVKGEFMRVMDIIKAVFSIFNFEDVEAQISLRDPKDKEKYIGSDEVWAESEQAIIDACKEKGLEAKVEYGEAAFYGPKLDFMVKDAIGRRWQLGTIQVDYNLPQRFKLEYTAEDNSKQTPVMVHRAPFGSMERFTAVLIEHTAGHFPLWLTPEQVAILPISEKYNDYAQKVCHYLSEQGVRASVDDRNEKIGRKIRDNELKRVPYMVIVGEQEAAEGLVAMRKQGGGEQATMKMEEFAQRINAEVAEMLKATNFKPQD